MEEDPKVDRLHHCRDLLLLLVLGPICLSRLVYMSASLDALFFVFWAAIFLVSEKIGKPTKYWLAAFMLANAVIKVIFAWYF